MEQFSHLDFSGQTIFAGIDVHKNSWKVCLRSNEMELRTFSQNPSVKDLTAHLKKNYPGACYKVVYEAGFCGFHYQRSFAQAGVDCIIVHPCDVPTSDKEKHRKSDTVDCRKLSKTLSEGALRGIFVPQVQQQDDRGIIRFYQQMVRNQTRTKNQIRGWLNFQGVTVEDGDGQRYWSNNFLNGSVGSNWRHRQGYTWTCCYRTTNRCEQWY